MFISYPSLKLKFLDQSYSPVLFSCSLKCHDRFKAFQINHVAQSRFHVVSNDNTKSKTLRPIIQLKSHFDSISRTQIQRFLFQWQQYRLKGSWTNQIAQPRFHIDFNGNNIDSKALGPIK